MADSKLLLEKEMMMEMMMKMRKKRCNLWKAANPIGFAVKTAAHRRFL